MDLPRGTEFRLVQKLYERKEQKNIGYLSPYLSPAPQVHFFRYEPSTVVNLEPSPQEITADKNGEVLLFALETFMQFLKGAELETKVLYLYLACALIFEKDKVLKRNKMPGISFVLGGTKYLVSTLLSGETGCSLALQGIHVYS